MAKISSRNKIGSELASYYLFCDLWYIYKNNLLHNYYFFKDRKFQITIFRIIFTC